MLGYAEDQEFPPGAYRARSWTRRRDLLAGRAVRRAVPPGDGFRP